MSESNKPVGAGNVHKLLSQRVALMDQLRKLDSDIVMQLKEGADHAYQPLNQESICRLIENSRGALKVNELCAISGVVPATYYNIMTKVDSVKISTVQSVLNAIGLDLFVGKRQSFERINSVGE